MNRSDRQRKAGSSKRGQHKHKDSVGRGGRDFRGVTSACSAGRHFRATRGGIAGTVCHPAQSGSAAAGRQGRNGRRLRFRGGVDKARREITQSRQKTHAYQNRQPPPQQNRFVPFRLPFPGSCCREYTRLQPSLRPCLNCDLSDFRMDCDCSRTDYETRPHHSKSFNQTNHSSDKVQGENSKWL